jgi:hypothetical protein
MVPGRERRALVRPRLCTGGLRRTHLREHQNLLKRLPVHSGAFTSARSSGTRSGAARRADCKDVGSTPLRVKSPSGHSPILSGRQRSSLNALGAAPPRPAHVIGSRARVLNPGTSTMGCQAVPACTARRGRLGGTGRRVRADAADAVARVPAQGDEPLDGGGASSMKGSGTSPAGSADRSPARWTAPASEAVTVCCRRGSRFPLDVADRQRVLRLRASQPRRSRS